MSQELALLIECSADLKRDLVRFAQGPRFERPLTALMDAAGPDGELDEATAIGVTDCSRCSTACLAAIPWWTGWWPAWPDLTAADREMLLGWRDPVGGSSRFAPRTGMRSSC